MVSTKPPAGTRDFLPAELARRQAVLDTIAEVYRRHHFEPIETPVIERIEVLDGKYGEEGDQLMFRVLKRGQKLTRALEAEQAPSRRDLVDFGLRYDLTVPLCRLVAQYQSALPKIFKCYQLRPVWRADRPAKGRFREFYQCDVDIVGTTGVLAEVDVITAAAEALEALGFDDFVVRLNDRQLLSALTQSLGVPEVLSGQVLVSLDKLDKLGRDGVRRELHERGLADERIDRLFAIVQPEEPASLEAFAAALGEHAPEASVARLSELLSLLQAAGVPAERASFDPSLVRGLSYYTGPIFEVSIPGFSGSVGGGGRYDDLVGMFLGRPIPACGISLGVERLLMIMAERGMTIGESAGCDVFIAQFKGVSPALGLETATLLRRAGYRVDLHPESPKLKKQFSVAEQRGARAVVMIGPDEVAERVVKVKNMTTGEQRTIAPEALVQALKDWA